MKKRTMAGQIKGPFIGTLRETASGEPITMYSGNAAIEYKVILEHNLRALSSLVPSCDGDNFALFLLRRGAHHHLLHDSTCKIFPTKDRLGLTTFIDPLKGEYERKCLEHSVGPGAVSCSFQLQENGFIDGPEYFRSLPGECRMTVIGSAKEFARIDAGGVKASKQAHQGKGLEASSPDSLFFGTCALNSSIGVKKLEYLTQDREWGA